MKKILTIVLHIIITSSYAQSIELNDKLKAFQKLAVLDEGAIISHDMRVMLFPRHDHLSYDYLRFDGIHYSNNNYIVVLTTHFNKNEPHKNYSQFLSSFSLNAETLDFMKINGGSRDCSSHDFSHSLFIDSIEFSVTNIYSQYNCGRGSLLNRSIEVIEYIISEEGRFTPTKKRKLHQNIGYEYRRLSNNIFSLDALQTKSKEELARMRNYIFASYGYKFKASVWQDYFSQFDWYSELKDEVAFDDLLTVEQINLKRITEAERQK